MLRCWSFHWRAFWFLGLPLLGFPLPAFGLRLGANLRFPAFLIGILSGPGLLEQGVCLGDPFLPDGQLLLSLLGELLCFALGGG